MPSSSTSNGRSNGHAANGVNGNGHDEDLAIETHSELLRTLSVDVEQRRGESDQLHIGRAAARDIVDGKETMRVGGSFTEEAHARTVNAVRLETTITGKMHAKALGDTTLVAGAVADTHHGPVALLAGMSDDLVAGGGIRVSTPIDIWLATLMGIDEHIGTAIADAALVEASITHFEREYGTGNHAAVLAVFNGQVYTTAATGFRPLMRVLKGIRDTSPGGGGGGAAAPPPGGGAAAAAGGGAMLAGGVAGGVVRSATRTNITDVVDIAKSVEHSTEILDSLDELAEVGDIVELTARFDFDALAEDDLARAGDTLETLEDLRTGVDETENARPLGSNSYNQATQDFRTLDEAGQARYRAEFNEDNWMELIGYTPPSSTTTPPPAAASTEEITNLNQGLSPLLRRNLKRKKFKKIDFSDVDSVRDAIAVARAELEVEVARARQLRTAKLYDASDVAKVQAVLDAFNARVTDWENSLRQLQNVPVNPPTPPPAAAGPPPAWNFDEAVDSLAKQALQYRDKVRWDGHIQLRQTQQALLDAAAGNEALLRELMDPEDFATLAHLNSFTDSINGPKQIRQALADLSSTLTDASDLARVTEALENLDQFAEARITADLQRAADIDAISRADWPFAVDQQALVQSIQDEITRLDESIEAIEDPAAKIDAIQTNGPAFNSYAEAVGEIQAGNNPLHQLDSNIRMSEFRLETIKNNPQLDDATRAANIATEQSQLAVLKQTRARVSGLMSSHSLESADQILRRYQLGHGGSLFGAPGSPTTAKNFQFDPFQAGRAGDLGDVDVSSAITRFQEQLDADLFSNQVDAARALTTAEDELRQFGANFRPMLEAGLSPDEFARIDFDDFASIRAGLESLANSAVGDEALVARQTLTNFDRHIYDTLEAAMVSADNARGSAGNWDAGQQQLMAQALANRVQINRQLGDNDLAARYRTLAVATQSGSDPLQVLDDQIKRTQEWLSTDQNPVMRAPDGTVIGVNPRSQAMRDQLASLLRMRAEVADLVGDIAPRAVVASGTDLVDVLSSAPVVGKTDAWDNLWQPLQATKEIDDFKASVGNAARFVDAQGAAGSTAELLRADDLTSAHGVIGAADDGGTTAPRTTAIDSVDAVDSIDDARQVWAWPAPATPLPDGIDKDAFGLKLWNSENALTNPRGASDAQEAAAARTAAFQLALQRVDDGLDPIAGIDEYITLAKADGASNLEIQAYEDVRRGIVEAMSEEYLKGVGNAQPLRSPPPVQKGKKGKKGKAASGITIELTDSVADMDFGPPLPLPERTPDEVVKIVDISQDGRVVGTIQDAGLPVIVDAEEVRNAANVRRNQEGGWLKGGSRSRWQRRRQRGVRFQRAKRYRLRQSGWRWRNPFTFRKKFTRSVSNLQQATDADVVVRLDAIEVETAPPQAAADGVTPQAGTTNPQALLEVTENEELQHVVEASEAHIYDPVAADEGVRHGYDMIDLPADAVEAEHYGTARTIHIVDSRNTGGYVNIGVQRARADGFKPQPPLPLDSGYKSIDSELDMVVNGKEGESIRARVKYFNRRKAAAAARGRPKAMPTQYKTLNAKQWLDAGNAHIGDDGKIVFHLDKKTMERMYGTFNGAGAPFDDSFRLDYKWQLEVDAVDADGNPLPLSAYRFDTVTDEGASQKSRLMAMAADQDASYRAGGRQAKMNAELNAQYDEAEAAHRAFLLDKHHSDDWLNYPMPLPGNVAPMPDVKLVVDDATGVGSFVRIPAPL